MYYIGKVSKIENNYSVRVYIPGVCEEDPGMLALPKRGEIDEPKVGDIVLVTELDPIFGSLLLYEKLRLDEFNGFRYHGKAISLNDEEIIILTFETGEESYSEDSVPEPKSFIKITQEGNIEINSENSLNITVTGDAKITAKSITIDGTTTIDGTCTTPSTGGGFNCIPICPFTGAQHQSNRIIK